jgi:hypothetical protein
MIMSSKTAISIKDLLTDIAAMFPRTGSIRLNPAWRPWFNDATQTLKVEFLTTYASAPNVFVSIYFKSRRTHKNVIEIGSTDYEVGAYFHFKAFSMEQFGIVTPKTTFKAPYVHMQAVNAIRFLDIVGTIKSRLVMLGAVKSK